MADAEHITKTLQMMMDQIEEDERAINEKKRAANALKRLLDETPLFPNIDLVASAHVRPDEFYGRPMVDVVKAVLEKRKQAGLGSATVAEIHDGMVRGGFQFQTDNATYAKRGVYSALADAQFHKLPDGRYGLTSWYPAAKTKTEATEGKGHKKRHKTRKKRPEVAPAASPDLSRSHDLQGDDGDAGPTALILKYVRSHPRCMPAQVVDAVAPELTTKSKNPRGLLRAMIRQLVKSGKLKRIGESRELEVAV